MAITSYIPKNILIKEYSINSSELVSNFLETSIHKNIFMSVTLSAKKHRFFEGNMEDKLHEKCPVRILPTLKYCVNSVIILYNILCHYGNFSNDTSYE